MKIGISSPDMKGTTTQDRDIFCCFLTGFTMNFFEVMKLTFPMGKIRNDRCSSRGDVLKTQSFRHFLPDFRT